MSASLLHDVSHPQAEAGDRRRPDRVDEPTDDLIRMFRDPPGAAWSGDLPPFKDDFLDEIVLIPSSPESRANEKVAVLHVATIISAIAAACIVFGG